MSAFTIGDVTLQVLGDDPFYEQVKHEIENIYELDRIPFEPGDVVLDIGAHVGLVSMYLAAKHPGIRVYCYEPVAENFERLREHIRLNGMSKSVVPHKRAVTADGGNRVMVRGGHHSGGATAFHDFEREPFTVRSTTVPRILERYRIETVRLLKLDCEGAEHEILGTGGEWIGRVQHIRGEIHQVRRDHDAVACSGGVPDVVWTFA